MDRILEHISTLIRQSYFNNNPGLYGTTKAFVINFCFPFLHITAELPPYYKHNRKIIHFIHIQLKILIHNVLEYVNGLIVDGFNVFQNDHVNGITINVTIIVNNHTNNQITTICLSIIILVEDCDVYITDNHLPIEQLNYSILLGNFWCNNFYLNNALCDDVSYVSLHIHINVGLHFD